MTVYHAWALHCVVGVSKDSSMGVGKDSSIGVCKDSGMELVRTRGVVRD